MRLETGFRAKILRTEKTTERRQRTVVFTMCLHAQLRGPIGLQRTDARAAPLGGRLYHQFVQGPDERIHAVG